MKFELKPFSRRKCEPANDVSSEELLGDLIRVLKQINKSTVTSVEYRTHGKYGSKALVKRFGQSWFDVLNAAGLGATRSKINIPTDEMLEDIRQVASRLNKGTLTQLEYKDQGGKFSCSAICKRFGGSWFKALEAIGLKRSRNYGVTEGEYFKNLEEIWIKLGRQPLYSEIERPLSRFSTGAYEQRFGSWRKALEAFVAYMNADENEPNLAEPVADESPPLASAKLEVRPSLSDHPSIIHKTRRQVSDRLRFRIFYRDGMTCKICGKSRAKYQDLELAVDHIFPWSKGGETVFENLQTLCRSCNGGKGDLGQGD
jgi:hypothetical protein